MLFARYMRLLAMLCLTAGVVASPVHALQVSASGCTDGSLCLVKPVATEAGSASAQVDCCNKQSHNPKPARGCSDCRFCYVATTPMMAHQPISLSYDAPSQISVVLAPHWRPVDVTHKLLRPPRA